MLRNLGIRWQILSALALPVLVLGLISSQVTYQALVDMRAASQSRELAQAADGFADLVGGLQAERALSVGVAIGQEGAAEQLKAVRAAVDGGLAAVRARIYSGSSSDAVEQIFARSATGHNGLTALRAEVDAGKVEARAIVSRYSDVIAADVEVPSDLASTLSSQDAAVNFQQFAQISRAGEALAQEQLIGASAIMNRKADTVDQRELGAQEAAGELALNAFRRSADADRLAELKTALAAPAARSLDLAAARAAFRFAGTTNRPDVTLKDWTAITTGQLAALRGALDGLNQDGIELANADHASAEQRLQLTLAGAISITLLTLLLALGLSRRISAPLRRLTLAATQIRDELPKIVESVQADADYELNLPTVQIIGRNEVSQLAAAFVDVNAVTVAIAHEQARLRAAVADMFVNVARRNQVLLSRQLSLIDQLERNEVNPDALEELFRLDHLATRMRRNAESLLVLAGIESGRRLRDPMPLSDVVRTATSEIEHYSRVSLSLEADPPVFAHLALPIAHLLAELLENATNFSDPGSAVVVMASTTNQGIRMTVADDGLGIPASELAEINARIEQPPTAEALSSQRLGFFVVGRLAQRLDAKVTLTSGRSGGTAVLIDLPTSLFVPGSVGGSPAERQSAAGQPTGSFGPTIPDQGGAPAWTPEPVGALAATSPFVAAFPPAAPTAAATAVAPSGPAPIALPIAFNAAAFAAETALEPVWTPQPDNLPSTDQATPMIQQPAASGLPARRGAGSAEAEPLAVPQLLPLPTSPSIDSTINPSANSAANSTFSPTVSPPVEPPVSLPIAMPVSEPVAMPDAEPKAEQSGAIEAVIDAPGEVTPEWAESDWAVSDWVAPTEAEPATSDETVAEPVAPVAGQSGTSIFSGFRSRQAAAKPEAVVDPEPAPEPDVPPVPEATAPTEAAEAEAAPMVFLDSAAAVDEWFGAGANRTPAADQWQTWDEVATPEPSESAPIEPALPVPSWDDEGITGFLPPQASFDADGQDDGQAPALTDPIPVTWVPAVEPDAWAPELTAAEPSPEAWVPEVWTPEPVASIGQPEPVAFEPTPEVWTPEPAAQARTPEPVAEVWTPEPVAEVWTPEPVAETWAPEPAPQPWAPVADTWTPEPVAEVWAPEPVAEAWTPEPVAEVWTPEPVAETWAPEPAAQAWTPDPAAEYWTPDPAVETWAPDPVAPDPAASVTPSLVAETWTPELAPAIWTPEPANEVRTPEPAASYQPQAEPWTPQAGPGNWTPESWAPEPEAWTPVPQPQPQPQPQVEPEPTAQPELRAAPVAESLAQTLNAAIDILPQRTSIRTALRRGRRRGDPQPTAGRPFNGGFDPIAPAREFALREGFGSIQEPVTSGLPAVPDGPASADPIAPGPTTGLVPEPSQPWSATGRVERRQHPRSGEPAPDHGRSALASEALTELSRLSSYSPTSMPSADGAGLQRRTPSEVPIDEPAPVVESSGQRARTAASVRSMLAGFKAGVERGRTSPAANRPASALPPPPRNSGSEEPR